MKSEATVVIRDWLAAIVSVARKTSLNGCVQLYMTTAVGVLGDKPHGYCSIKKVPPPLSSTNQRRCIDTWPERRSYKPISQYWNDYSGVG